MRAAREAQLARAVGQRTEVAHHPVVMAATAVLWLAANWAGQRYGWPSKYAFLADLAAIGGFVWSLLVTWRIWRRRNASSQGQG